MLCVISFNPRTHTGCDGFDAACQHGKVVSIHAPTQGATGHTAGHARGEIVSIHAPTQGATEAVGRHLVGGDVSIHAPTQGATRALRGTAIWFRFQSTHPHRVRLRCVRVHHRFRMFQSTHPHRVRLGAFECTIVFACFNPRTHTGCDFITIDAVFDIDVSIHAPTQGATEAVGRHLVGGDVSIHAPTQGATAHLFTLPRGDKVSIHAPTQGATTNKCTNVCLCVCFNPRTHTGCDLCLFVALCGLIVSIHAPTQGATARAHTLLPERLLFQSTHPHRVRPSSNKPLRSWRCFNPRTHTGCDWLLQIYP